MVKTVRHLTKVGTWLSFLTLLLGYTLFIPTLAQAAPGDLGDPATTPAVAAVSTRLNTLTGQIQSINEELTSQRANLSRLQVEIIAQRDETDSFRRELLKELKALRRQNQALLDSYEDGFLTNRKDMDEVKPLRNYDLQTPDGKLFLGESEFIYVKEADASIDARIDTGAAVSSIAAEDITEFERAGKRWYRFTINANNESITVEAPFVRSSIVRQSSSPESVQRIVVKLNIKIGDYSTASEFTLADRSKMQYPLLIGRSLIQDTAVVDVARDHIQKYNPDTFLILNRDAYQSAQAAGQDPNAAYKAKRASAAGQVATPEADYGFNLGSKSDNALPEVRNARRAAAETAVQNALGFNPDANAAPENKDSSTHKDGPAAPETTPASSPDTAASNTQKAQHAQVESKSNAKAEVTVNTKNSANGKSQDNSKKDKEVKAQDKGTGSK